MTSPSHTCPLNQKWEQHVRNFRSNELAFFAPFYRVSPDDYERQANEHLAKLLDDVHPFVRVGDDHALQGILRDDLVKNQFQTGTSKGFLSPPFRQMTEQSLFGLAMDCNHDQRPVYGYLHVSPDGRFADNLGQDFADNYGLICLRLRDDVRTRTTFTGGDSLIQTNKGQHPLVVAAPLVSPSLFALIPALSTPLQYPSAASLLQRITTPQLPPVPGVGYLEAQYHHPICRADIQEVFFYGQDPQQTTAEALNHFGVKWERLW